MIIYKIINKINGKIYIGQTTIGMKNRWKAHIKNSKNKKLNYYLYRAIREYGLENFNIEIVDNSAKTINELNNLEIKYILEFNSLAPNGYNLNTGGNQQIPSQETRNRMSQSQKNSPKCIERISILAELNKGKKASLETKIKLSNARSGKLHYGYGKNRSLETKNKISESMTGVPQPWKFKKVKCIETGEIFESVKELAKIMGIRQTSMSEAIRNGYKNKKTGFRFKYL